MLGGPRSSFLFCIRIRVFSGEFRVHTNRKQNTEDPKAPLSGKCQLPRTYITHPILCFRISILVSLFLFFLPEVLSSWTSLRTPY